MLPALRDPLATSSPSLRFSSLHLLTLHSRLQSRSYLTSTCAWLASDSDLFPELQSDRPWKFTLRASPPTGLFTHERGIAHSPASVAHQGVGTCYDPPKNDLLFASLRSHTRTKVHFLVVQPTSCVLYILTSLHFVSFLLVCDRSHLQEASTWCLRNY